MDKQIYLYWKDVKILSLKYENNQYIQNINIENLKQALSTGCPIHHLFNGNIEKNIVTKYLPLTFDRFNFSNAREDLIRTYDIKEEDTVFDKLYKVASKDDRMEHDDFWISIY